MSQEWVDLVRAGFEAIERGGMAIFDDFTTEDLVLVQPPEVPASKTYERRGGIVDSPRTGPSSGRTFAWT
jgi:ketosteroid isomerase-like protein